MKSILDTACENGDLTREGVLSAFNELEEVDTGGLIVPIEGFEVGKSPSHAELHPAPGRRPRWRQHRQGRLRRSARRPSSPAA